MCVGWHAARRAAGTQSERWPRANPLRAASLYEAVWRAQVPAHVRMAGLRGVMLTRGEAGINLLLEQLQSEDKLAFQTALRVACELPASPALTEKLLGLMSQLPPARQAKLLSVLADRGDPASRPAVVQALEHQDAEVRLAAVRALRKLGDASVVPALLRAASGEDQQLAQTAKEVLIALPGRGNRSGHRGLAANWQRENRVVAMELAARRYIHAAVPALQKALDAPESEVRLAAIRALGYTTKLGDLPVLTERLLQSQDKAERGGPGRSPEGGLSPNPGTGRMCRPLGSNLEESPGRVKAQSSPLSWELWG